jgi:hypothetical protein
MNPPSVDSKVEYIIQNICGDARRDIDDRVDVGPDAPELVKRGSKCFCAVPRNQTKGHGPCKIETVHMRSTCHRTGILSGDDGDNNLAGA